MVYIHCGNGMPQVETDMIDAGHSLQIFNQSKR